MKDCPHHCDDDGFIVDGNASGHAGVEYHPCPIHKPTPRATGGTKLKPLTGRYLDEFCEDPAGFLFTHDTMRDRAKDYITGLRTQLAEAQKALESISDTDIPEQSAGHVAIRDCAASMKTTATLALYPYKDSPCSPPSAAVSGVGVEAAFYAQPKPVQDAQLGKLLDELHKPDAPPPGEGAGRSLTADEIEGIRQSWLFSDRDTCGFHTSRNDVRRLLAHIDALTAKSAAMEKLVAAVECDSAWAVWINSRRTCEDRDVAVAVFARHGIEWGAESDTQMQALRTAALREGGA